jgi:hypothetical protein
VNDVIVISSPVDEPGQGGLAGDGSAGAHLDPSRFIGRAGLDAAFTHHRSYRHPAHLCVAVSPDAGVGHDFIAPLMFPGLWPVTSIMSEVVSA